MNSKELLKKMLYASYSIQTKKTKRKRASRTKMRTKMKKATKIGPQVTNLVPKKRRARRRRKKKRRTKRRSLGRRNMVILVKSLTLALIIIAAL